mmetsp:Transcript_5936/g.17761  ORF Transcript_5936/g.17761 Transcript_5936/m.17761 type:complete len:439 (-) Transcript_5936:40-1356(-)
MLALPQPGTATPLAFLLAALLADRPAPRFLLANGEAPPGAVPSAGTVHWFADYELRLSPEQLGAPPLQWRLAAWRFQQEFLTFYGQRAACEATPGLCPAPPLAAASFVLGLPDAARSQMLEECPGLLLASLLLVAEARLPMDAPEGQALFAEAERLRRLRPAPGWGLEEAAAWFEAASGSLAPRALPAAAGGCADARLDVVVAHCGEDLGWLAEIQGARIFVYEKCGPASLPPGAPCATAESLPNWAMESLAYATHLRERHGEFAEFTLFLHGAPREHAPRVLLEDVLASLRAGTHDTPFLHLSARRFLSGNSLCLQDFYRRLFEMEEVPEVFGSYCCNQFLVHRERLVARPRELYERLVRLLKGELPLLCVQDTKYDARPGIAVSALLEHLWHVVLGEAPVLPPRSTDGRLPLFARVDTSPPLTLPDQLGAPSDATV